MPAQTQRYEQILARMINRVVSRSALSDLTDSSAIKHLVAATARELDELHYQQTRLLDVWSVDSARGDDLDRRATEIQPGTISRRPATRAVGTVVISRSTNTGTVQNVPAGVVGKTQDGVLVRTTQAAQITSTSVEQVPGHGVGRDSAPIPAVAILAGAAGNIPAGAVRAFGTKPAGVDSITNLVGFTQGRDLEADDDFRRRIKAFVQSLARCDVRALELLALDVTDGVSGKSVAFAKVIEDIQYRGNVALYIDDGAGTADEHTAITGEIVTAGLSAGDAAVGGEEYLTLDNTPVRVASTFTLTSSTRGALTEGSDFALNPVTGLIRFLTPLAAGEQITAAYSHHTGLVREVQRVITGLAADRATYPGAQAAGVRVQVRVPTIIPVAVEVILALDGTRDRASVHAAVLAAILGYVNNLGISGDVIRNELIERIMAVPGVFDLTLVGPSGNLITLDDELPRITSSDVEIR